MDIAHGLWLELAWFWLAIVVLGAVMLGAFALVLRFGPRRGAWNQPAAALRPPGRGLRLALYGFALVHVLLGLAATTADSVGPSALLIATLMGSFYVACAQVMRLSSRVPARFQNSHAPS